MERLTLGSGNEGTKKDAGQKENASKYEGKKETESPKRYPSRHGADRKQSNPGGEDTNESGGVLDWRYRSRAGRAQTGRGGATERGGRYYKAMLGRGRGGDGWRGGIRGNANFGQAERQGARRKIPEFMQRTVNPPGRARTPHRDGLGFHALEDLSNEDPSVVAITLSSHPDLSRILGETTMKRDFIEILCLVLSKALKSKSDRSTMQHLAKILKDSSFFCNILPHYLGSLGVQFSTVSKTVYQQNLENILAILSEVLSMFPASSLEAAGVILTLFQAAVNRLRATGVDFKDQMEETVENLQGLLKHLQERCCQGTLRTDKDIYALLPAGGEEEQEDFRTIPIFPTPEEFMQEERPYLRPNLISQRYSSTHVYLDTHFRLLREDFVRPLREGIQQLLQEQADVGTTNKPLKTKRFDDIRVYFDAKLVVPKCTNSGLAYIVQFDVKPLKFVRWENSKRLIYGSLVCMSCDNFESFLFATVSDRDPKELVEGRVQLSFTDESRVKLAGIQDKMSFLMIETTAYFEAYRYVLEGLQEQTDEELPFQKYIVECSDEVQPPAYLRTDAEYNLSSVAVPESRPRLKPFDCLKMDAWPTMDELGLDESQMKAFQLALTKELAIIQGPPGTGKTYVGLKIANALLKNSNQREGLSGKPMLVVCYTNHALDQFLEGILEFLPNGIVRVGGRSNSEKLKPFSLRELSASQHFRNLKLGDAHRTIYREVCEKERDIKQHSIRLMCSFSGVLRETMLRNFMSVRHWDSLHLTSPEDEFITTNKKSSVMAEWLGLSSMGFQQRETEEPYRNKAVGAEKLEEEDLIEITEEADLIQAERFIEDWSYYRNHDGDDSRKESTKEDIAAAEDLMLAFNVNKAATEESIYGWQIPVEQKKKMKNKVKKRLRESSTMSEVEEDNVLNVWTLSLENRWRLYRLWLTRYQVHLRTKALEHEALYQNAVNRLAYVKQQQDLRLLMRATILPSSSLWDSWLLKVVGMTTTGAAKYRKMLQQLRPRLVIVEEAAEVLEAHVITTLSKDCQHLILIGDHQQVQILATVYELAKNFNLETSMFERLVNMGLPFVKLGYQHRMRPEIARLLTPHIYSELHNHPSVLTYEDIKGLKSNLFFVDHNYLEEEIKDGKSHQNQHEAQFVVSLCRYLLLQEYKPEQITILTTYTGQLHCLRNRMPAKMFAGVKVHVVDKYQGEENDIVLLSLVRSNAQGKVGFLSIPNRVCVALSRAKKGLYCIGNAAMLSQVKLWSNIFHTLREKDQVGKALTLYCQNHPEKQLHASCAEDFKEAPEGGCTEPCQFRLDCGHVCARVCHPYDQEHKEYKCGKPCQKILCDRGHKCTGVCHIKCPEKCPIKVEKIVPQCQHTQMVPCHQDPETFVCQEPCPKLLQCGHPCTSHCGEPCSKCKVLVTLTLKCGHSQQDFCFYKTQTEEPVCVTSCEHQLKCGHPCRGKCGLCYNGRFHSVCSQMCDRLLICSHKCGEPCTTSCPPCQKPCENCCVHSKCMKLCGQLCAPCTEPCAWQCRHHRCLKLCSEPCDRPPCSQPCDEQLQCGHNCIGLCGDKCPSKCRVCDREEVTEIFFGSEDDPDAHFIQLQDCGHIIEYTAMDKYMELDGTEEDDVAIKLKECPKCRTPIRRNLRYGSHINKCLAEIELVKKKINGQPQDIEPHRKTLKLQWKNILLSRSNHHHRNLKYITEWLNKSSLTANDIWHLDNQIDFQKRIGKLFDMETQKLWDVDQFRFSQSAEEFMSWLCYRRQSFTDQQVFDLERELHKLTCLAALNARCYLANKRQKMDKIQDDVQKIQMILEKVGQFTEEDQKTVKEAMAELDKKVPPTGLGISDEERQMIVSAMKMKPGHWHKCPNGHVYLITECGGATERRRCPDCDASIGGESHRLDSGNVVASEMDGAQHSAWSEAFNLANFGPLDF